MNVSGKIYFYTQLSTFLESGISIVRALELIAHNQRGAARKTTLKIYESVKSGSTLTQALSGMGNMFSGFEIAVVHSGEIAGRLEDNLRLIVDYFERNRRWKRILIIGMIYPVILIHLAIILPPLGIAFLKGFVCYLRTIFHPLAYIYAVFFSFLIIKKIIRQFTCIFAFCDRLLWSVPVAGKILRKLAVSRFAASLALSLKAGIDPVTALRTSAQACGNAVIKSQIAKAEYLLQNEGISGVLKKAEIFPEVLIEMAFTGEKSGCIDETLLKAASSLEDEANASAKVLLIVVPIIAYLAAALYIAYIIITFYMGYFQTVLPDLN